MAPHSSTHPWKIPWTEEPGRLQSMGSLRVGHDWATSLSLFTFMHWRRKWQPTPVFLPGEPQDGRAWWAAVYGVAQNRTRLKRRSSSSSSIYGRCFENYSSIISWWLISILNELRVLLPFIQGQTPICFSGNAGLCSSPQNSRGEVGQFYTLFINLLHKHCTFWALRKDKPLCWVWKHNDA